MSDQEPKVIGKMYVGRCFNCGKVVYGAIADTPAEQADCSRDIKRMIKDGYKVDLMDRVQGQPMPEWCADHKQCKKEFRAKKVQS